MTDTGDEFKEIKIGDEESFNTTKITMKKQFGNLKATL